MRNPLLVAGLSAALIVTAACSKKKPADLPPPPPSSSQPAGPPVDPNASGTGDTGVGTSNLPGSQSDFVAQSGSDRVLFGYDSYEVDD